jgi:hypothetical protein
MLTPTKIVVPPWALKGNGYILVYHFPQDFIENQCFLTDLPNRKTWLRVGCVMIVDYHTSEVGAYQELLFIPAFFDFAGQKAFHISKIYVSTYDSVYNGIENWGIPKELADFKIVRTTQHTCQVSANTANKDFFQIRLKSFGIPFPITTSLFPFTFYQKHQDKILKTSPKGTGWGKLCKIEDINVNREYFPDITLFKPLLAIEVNDFSMRFPQPKIASDVQIL